MIGFRRRVGPNISTFCGRQSRRVVHLLSHGRLLRTNAGRNHSDVRVRSTHRRTKLVHVPARRRGRRALRSVQDGMSVLAAVLGGSRGAVVVHWSAIASRIHFVGTRAFSSSNQFATTTKLACEAVELAPVSSLIMRNR